MNRPHKAEMIRFAESPKGTKCWVKDSKHGWIPTGVPTWPENNIHIVDDVHAELRKLQIDKPETKFKVKLSAEWEDAPNISSWPLDTEYKVAHWADDAIGKLCVFADREEWLIVGHQKSITDILIAVNNISNYNISNYNYTNRNNSWKHCRLLTKEDLK